MKILSIDKNHPKLNENLRKKSFEVEEDYLSSYDEILAIISQYDGLILRSRIPIDENLLEKATNLKFIARVGAGMENIDCEFAQSKNIFLINSPEGNADSLAEHAVGMLLCLMHKIRISDREVRKNIWLREENRGDELLGKTVGLLGYGNMGKAFAKRLQGFGVEVICYDIEENVGDDYAKQVSLVQIFAETDILSIHLPLTENTFYIIDNEFINNFKKNIYILNTARGKNVKTNDLIENLKSGKIIGACLDVLEYEQSSFENIDHNTDLQYLKQSDNVILTPHIAGWSVQSNEKMANIIVDKICKFVENSK